MRPYTVEELVWETPSTFTLRLTPDAGEGELLFKAGQWVYLHLLNEDGSSWGKAAFSLAMAPHERPLELCIKIAGDFTRKASNMSPGTRVMLQGPFGVFVPPVQPETPLLFCAGGIGVTPLRSMIRDLLVRGVTTRMALVYSNRYSEEAAYMEEMYAFANQYPHFQCIATLTGESPHGWPGKLGRIDQVMLREAVDWLGASPQVYMCGPNHFMDAVRTCLGEVGVANSSIHQERFS